MDQCMWQTLESIDFIYSSYLWIQTVLSRGKHCQTLQIGTVLRLWLCGRSWRFEIHFWRNIMYFWKSYICSNKLDVQETNCCFSQFNRIWNYLSGHWTEIGWVACSGTMGSNCFCYWEMFLVFQMDQGNLRVMFTNVISLTRKTMSMKDIDSVPSNVQSASQEALLYVFEDNEAVIKMIMKGRSPTMRHVSRTHTELLLIGCSIELIWTPKFKSNTSTPRTNSQTSWQRGISHVTNGIICWPCLISAILALLPASLQWQNELNKNQEKNVSQQNRDLWWINSENAFGRVVFNFIKLGRTSYGYQDPGKSVAGDDRSGKLERPSPPGYSKEDYGQSWSSQEWKSGAVANDRSGKPEKTSWDMMQQTAPHREERLAHFMMDRGNLRKLIHKKEQIPKFSSWEVTQQNLWIK